MLEDEIPAYTKHPDATTDGVRYWECLICEGETPETVPAHECEDYSDNNWVQHEDWPSELHVAHCTFTYGDGKLCDNTINRDHVMTGEFHVDADTIRDECTVCDFFREYTGTASAVGVPAKDATCTAPGNVACWSCSHCGNYFADEACSRILTPGEVFTQPAAHSYGEDGVCTVCGEKVIRARFAETPEDTFSSEDEYLYVLAGKDADGNVYVMGEAMDGGKREAVKVDGANIDQNGVLTLRSDEVEFMDFEYYFEDGASASTTSTFTVDGGYMTVRNGKVYVFPRERLDDPANPRPFEFCQASYGDDSGLGSVEADLYDPETYKHDCEYMTFNAETLCFEACESEEYTVYLYREICDHRPDDVIHYNDAPTCTEQGIREHWACDKCGKLFSDGSATTPYVFPEYVDPDSYRDVDEYFHLPALGHRFGADDTCENCGMSRPVYRPVTTLEEFDKLSEDAYYLIVFKDLEGLATVPDVGGGEGGDAIPSSESGVEEVIPGEDDGSGDTPPPTPETGGEAGSDRYSEKTFAAALPMLTNPYESEALNAANIVEVTVVADGSITVTDEGAMETTHRRNQ